MNTFKHILLASALVLTASAASAAVNPLTGMPTETPQHIYDRCGIVLTNPNAIVAAAGAPCSYVGVQAMLAPRDEAPNAE